MSRHKSIVVCYDHACLMIFIFQAEAVSVSPPADGLKPEAHGQSEACTYSASRHLEAQGSVERHNEFRL